MRFTRFVAALTASALLTPAAAWAQTTSSSSSLSQLFTNLLVQGVTVISAPGSPGNPHDAHFLAPLAEQLAPFQISKDIVTQLGTFPIGSSSSGFFLKLDPATGVRHPASVSFGPGFAERAVTNGKGEIGLGVNYRHLEFSSFDGFNLGDGSIGFVLQHNDCCGGANTPDNPFFEGDLLETSVSLSVKADEYAPFVSYGLSDRWDVGFVAPIVHVSLGASLFETIDRVSTFDNPLIHSFDGKGADTETVAQSGSATGLGDIQLRTKYRFIDGANGGLAAGLDVRLPTGDKNNLLGTGATQTKLSLIASAEYGSLAPHVNLGYTISRGGLSSSLVTLNVPPDTLTTTDSSTAQAGTTGAQVNAVNGVPLNVNLNVPNEFDYVFGTDFFTRTMTMSVDIVGRSLSTADTFANEPTTYTYFTDNGTGVTDLAHPHTVTQSSIADTGSGRLNLLLGVVGVKVQLPNTRLLLTGSVLFPLTNAGLKPNVTPIIGLDYSFGR